MADNQEVHFCDLPAEIIQKIFSSFDYRDLRNCKVLCRRLRDLARYDSHWERLTRKYWLLQTCPAGMTWEQLFIHWYVDFGRYIHCYARLRRIWDKILTYYEANCPQIYQTIKSGVSDDVLDSMEESLGMGELPLDFRCSYRMHNGQRLTSPGLLGSISFPGYYRSESLLDIDTILVGQRGHRGLQGCVPLSLCLHSGQSHYLVINEEDAYEPNSVVFPITSGVRNNMKFLDSFIEASSFTEWLSRHADHLANNDFVLIENQPFRYLHDPEAEETTNHITVTVATCFLPDFSTIEPPKFFHTYRITMTMSPDASEEESCQLETRHWLITDENGSEEQVEGPGVVGQYPIMSPGSKFSWVSGTSFATTYGNMRGYFQMRNLFTSDRITVKCPVFHMKCHPYIGGEEREQLKNKRSGEL